MKRTFTRRIFSSLAIISAAVVISACTGFQHSADTGYEDGTYRGMYGESDNNVAIQFTLEDNVVTKISYRHLTYKRDDYRTKDNAKVTAIGSQYVALVDHLIGKDIRSHLSDFYTPGDFVADVDGHSGATIRSTKVRSAIMDGLNRGVYSY